MSTNPAVALLKEIGGQLAEVLVWFVRGPLDDGGDVVVLVHHDEVLQNVRVIVKPSATDLRSWMDGLLDPMTEDAENYASLVKEISAPLAPPAPPNRRVRAIVGTPEGVWTVVSMTMIPATARGGDA